MITGDNMKFNSVKLDLKQVNKGMIPCLPGVPEAESLTPVAKNSKMARKNRQDMARNQNGSNIRTKLSDDVENKLSQLYYNPRSPVPFNGIDTIYNYLKDKKGFEKLSQLSRRDVKIWLSKQEAYTSHHPVRRKFPRPKVISFSLNY